MPSFRPLGFVSRLAAAAVVVVGFYLLWLGFVDGNAIKAVLGGVLIPAGLYLMVSSRREEIRRQSDASAPLDDPTDDAP